MPDGYLMGKTKSSINPPCKTNITIKYIIHCTIFPEAREKCQIPNNLCIYVEVF